MAFARSRATKPATNETLCGNVFRRSHALTGIVLGVSLLLPGTFQLPAFAAKTKEKVQPAGTLLLPLTPKIDDGSVEAPLSPTSQSQLPASASASADSAAPGASKRVAKKTSTASRSTIQAAAPRQSLAARPPVAAPSRSAAARHAQAAQTQPVSTNTTGALPAPSSTPPAPPNYSAQSAPNSISAESGTADEVTAGTMDANQLAPIDESSLLKGTVEITADDTEYDQEKNTFLGTGNAVAIIAGQNSKLEADTILYDQNNNTIDARGSVKILRDGQLTTGSSFKFKVDSDEYLITDPDTELQGTTVVARTAKGTADGLAFRNGTFTLPQAVHITNNAFWGPLSSAERVADETDHPDAFVPVKPSYKFTARKMIYERYLDAGNLTVYGGKMKFEHFTLPMPKFTANVGSNSHVVLPVLPLIGNNMQVGGTNIGPQFNYPVGKSGAFSWAPLLQYGGRSLSGGTAVNNSSKFGAGFKLAYTDDRLTTHLAYGSVSNILVADLKYKISPATMFQSGINRFLNDGFFGVRRARVLAEVVDTRGVGSLPYISWLGFRTSGGWAQDSPGLVGLSGSQYSQLFNTAGKKKVGAYRLQEQITLSTHPIFSVGDSKYGTQLNFFAGAAARAYSTGDSMLVGQVGPNLTTKLNKLRFQIGYAQSAVRGQSPFVFDQFIQGNRSTFFNGDVKLSKWLTLGTSLGYNLDSKMMYTKAITAAIGPDDFKLLVRRDTITGFNRVGFDLLYGQPVPFNKLIVKGKPDAGQLGGI